MIIRHEEFKVLKEKGLVYNTRVYLYLKKCLVGTIDIWDLKDIHICDYKEYSTLSTFNNSAQFVICYDSVEFEEF